MDAISGPASQLSTDWVRDWAQRFLGGCHRPSTSRRKTMGERTSLLGPLDPGRPLTQLALARTAARPPSPSVLLASIRSDDIGVRVRQRASAKSLQVASSFAYFANVWHAWALAGSSWRSLVARVRMPRLACASRSELW